MIKNVVFDLGRVIYTYAPLDDLVEHGLSKEAVERFMERIYDSPMWQEIDRGTYTVAGAVKKWCSIYPDMEQDLRLIFNDGWIDRIISIMPDSLEFFYKVKERGFKIYLLTNFSEDAFAHVSARDSFFDDVDGMIVSAHEKLIKPDPAIYHCLLDRYNLIAEETIFIDDLAPNVAAAKDVGIQAIQFTTLEEVKRQFEEIVKCA